LLNTLNRRRLLRLWLLGIVALVSLVAVACGDDSDDDEGTPTSATRPAGTTPAGSPTASGDDGFDYDVDGEIRIDGSSTVFPIGEAVAEEFGNASSARATVASSGTGAGFEKFCRGESDISQASRPIEEDEIADCAAEGIDDILEIQVAIDALTVMVNPANDFVQCLTVDQLYAIFSDTTDAQSWSDVDPSFPDQPISKFYPGEDSGTFDYFVEAIIEETEEEGLHTASGTPSEDDNVLAVGLENDENAIGYFGFSYFLGAGSNLKAVEIDGGEGCVAPSFETALDGSYVPLSRPLFIYVSESALEENPAVLAFTKFYMDNIQELVPEVGYVTMPEDLYAEELAKVDAFIS
jgi:phosphate transport system substrate-binding protein